MNRKRLNLVLAALALALAGIAVLHQHKPAPKVVPLTPLKAEGVDRVVIHHPGAADVVLQKAAGTWQLTAPVLAAADALEVAGLTGLAEQETHAAIDPKEVKLADLGLEPPGFSITLNNVELDFGGVETLSYRRYVESGGKIYLIDDPASGVVGASYPHLLGKSLLPEGAQIVALTLPGLAIARSADGKSWEVTPPDPHAGSDAPQKLADAWAAAHSLWNSEVAAPAAGAPPADTATVRLKDGQTLSFRIASRDPQLALDRDDLKVRYNLSASEAANLLKLPEPPPAAPAAPAPPAPAGAGSKQ
jgi:hypothetical protein